MIQIKKIKSSSEKSYEELWDKVRVMNCGKKLSNNSYHQIVTDFFEKNHRIDFLIKAIDEEKSSVILQECHSLKGASSMIGLIGFNDLIESIEQCVSKKEFFNKNALIENLKNILNISKETFFKYNQGKE
jgi:HPt (histidine-containing phosphotransfer) domain-containing protein